MATIHLVKKLAVQWQIGNQCNFRCDYCHHDYHSGSNPFLDYEQFQKGFFNLERSVTDYEQVTIEFQGGEPTISPAIRNKVADPGVTRYKYILQTNASADLEWWHLAVKNLSEVSLAYHPQVDTEHFKQVVEIVRANCPKWGISVNAHPDHDRWEKAVSIYEFYKNQNVYVTFRALFADHNRGNQQFLEYTPEQWAYYTRANHIEVPVEITEIPAQIHWVESHLYNNYKGHLCWAGVEQIVVDYFGYVYRSWCHAHGALGNIFEKSVTLDTSPKVCPKGLCKNKFDQQAKKSEKSWGM